MNNGRDQQNHVYRPSRSIGLPGNTARLQAVNVGYVTYRPIIQHVLAIFAFKLAVRMKQPEDPIAQSRPSTTPRSPNGADIENNLWALNAGSMTFHILYDMPTSAGWWLKLRC